MFINDSYYTRKEVWAKLNSETSYPKGGNWTTGYVVENNLLIIFANIDSPGRTGHDFPNEYDHEKKEMHWYGKPNAHSQQQTFRNLFDGILIPHVFVRWDNKNTSFLYLGVPLISSFSDGFHIHDSLETIQIVFTWDTHRQNLLVEERSLSALEGKQVRTLSRRYERNPALRSACIAHFGVICQTCGFDFEAVYGDLGKDYCQVHHIVPLSDIKGSHHVNPLTDLIPLCANCHAMIHRGDEILLPVDLKNIINRTK
jgi:5-methylcytosine-specific restriction protein A